MENTVLVTGGTGYIGSHTCIALIESGYKLVILDNLSNSKLSVVEKIESITRVHPTFVKGDIRDKKLLGELFQQYRPSAVIHFAGLKSVGESVSQPLRYYDWNVSGTVCLCEAMAEANVKTLVFSSSATVYGDPASVPITEDFPLGATNPYGRSKLIIEEILADLYKSDNSWRIARLRYFNPVGAHESGLIGEEPNGVPNNLLPYVAQVAVGQREFLSVFGDDYPTNDGTGVRDYIHVLDLASGHVAALDFLLKNNEMLTVNLGTGRGYSVLEMVNAFERASGRKIPYRVVARRPGDIAECVADPKLAQTMLSWKANRDIDKMCSDAWRWQQYAVKKGN